MLVFIHFDSGSENFDECGEVVLGTRGGQNTFVCSVGRELGGEGGKKGIREGEGGGKGSIHQYQSVWRQFEKEFQLEEKKRKRTEKRETGEEKTTKERVKGREKVFETRKEKKIKDKQFENTREVSGFNRISIAHTCIRSNDTEAFSSNGNTSSEGVECEDSRKIRQKY